MHRQPKAQDRLLIIFIRETQLESVGDSIAIRLKLADTAATCPSRGNLGIPILIDI